jgi:hypothetical protein
VHLLAEEVDSLTEALEPLPVCLREAETWAWGVPAACTRRTSEPEVAAAAGLQAWGHSGRTQCTNELAAHVAEVGSFQLVEHALVDRGMPSGPRLAKTGARMRCTNGLLTAAVDAAEVVAAGPR